MANSYNELFGYGTHSVDADLKGHWLLQESSGTSASDRSGNGYGLTLTSAPGQNLGDYIENSGPNSWLPRAFRFYGVNGYLLSAADFASGITNGTVVCWANGANVGNARIVDNDATNGFWVGTDSNILGAFRIASSPFGSTRAYSSGWVHIGLVRTGADNVIYTNGTAGTTYTSSSSATSAAKIAVGRTNTGITAYTGLACGVSVFSRALTTGELDETRLGPEPLNTVAPTVSGSTTVGSVLTSTTGTWNSQSNGTVTFTYQWTKDGTNISGATSSTYTTVSGDAGGVIRCRVRGTNDGGFDSAQDTVSSNSVTVDAAGTTVTPGVASLSITRYIPTILTPQTVTPPTTAVSTTSFAPSVLTPQTVTPPTQTLTLATFAPLVTATANQVATPTTATLTTNRLAPTVSVSSANNVTPPTATLTLATFAPTVTATANLVAAPTTASLSLSAFAPTVNVANASVTVTPLTASLTLATFAPSLSAAGSTWTITFTGSESCSGDLNAKITTGGLTAKQTTGDLTARQLENV